MIVNEFWNIGTFKNVKYMGVGRTFGEIKYFVFEKPESGFLLVKKDEFYSGTLSKEKVR